MVWVQPNTRSLRLPAHRVGCQRIIASVIASAPTTRFSSAPSGQTRPSGWNFSGTMSRLAQFVALSGDESSQWWGLSSPLVPFTSVSPRGTMTSQQDRPVPLASNDPQPSPGASRAVCTSKNSSPVPSGLVRPYGISLVVATSKYSPPVPLVTASPSTGVNGA